MAVIFKTLKEARDYILKDPVGKSWKTLDDGSGFEVKSKNRELPQLQQTKDKDEILSRDEINKLIGTMPKKKNKTVKKAQVRKEDWFQTKYRQVVKRFQQSEKKWNKEFEYEKRKAHPHKPKPASGSGKRYIIDTWGSREDWKKMRGRQSAINKTNKN